MLARADLQEKQQSWAPELHLYSEKRTLKKSRKKLDVSIRFVWDNSVFGSYRLGLRVLVMMTHALM